MAEFLINGQAANQLPVEDRGLHYGDGVFETIAVEKGQPLCWQQHWDRLQRGAQALAIPIPQQEQVTAELKQLINNSDRAVIKLIITRGQGGRGYKLPPQIQPTRILGLYPFPDYSTINPLAGVNVRLCKYRIQHNQRLAGIKHLNRLDQVLARAEWNDEYAEGIMQDVAGNLIEGTMSNFFLIKEQQLLTPDLSLCGIHGIIRERILAIADTFGLQATVCELDESSLYDATEMFLCNSIIGIWPVKKYRDHEFQNTAITLGIREQLLANKIIAG